MLYFYICFFVIFIWAIVQAWLHQSTTETISPWKSYSHLLAWYLPYLLFPLFVCILYLTWTDKLSWFWGISFAIIVGCCIYARFIEPYCLRVQYHTKSAFLNHQTEHSSVKIALIADLHIGLFSGHQRQLKRIVHQLNQIQPDFVLVAGDWTYEPYDTLIDDLKILKDIQCPVYSVLGNHDEQCPGPPIKAMLQQGLIEADIIDIEGQLIEYESFYLAGIGDLWAGHADMQILKQYPTNKPFLLLSHNPDTAEMVPTLNTPTLMLSGHTHGGQIALPWITRYYLRRTSMCGHNQGWYSHQNTELFVTVGTGMVGVPFRFRTPPTIDVIQLQS